MITYAPSVPDSINDYMTVPMLATLYGRDQIPHRFLRVVDDIDLPSGREITTFNSDPTDPNSLCVVETAALSTFLEFITYGYTPYIESLMAGYKNGLNSLTDKTEYIYTQAMLRNYEFRAKTLIDMCENKKYSIFGRSTAASSTSELVDELWGVLTVWETFMNHGAIRPKDCLSHIPEKHNHATIPLKRFQEKFSELEYRMLNNNHRDMPFKLHEKLRQQFIQMYTG